MARARGASWRPPSLYLITSRDATAGRPLVDVIAAALAAAAPFRRENGQLPVAVCLREKDLSGSALFALGCEILAVTCSAGAELFINGRLDVALALGAQGVHLPSTGAITPAEVAAAAPHLRVGISTHTPEDVLHARDFGDAVDFAVFGPVFETPSKQGIFTPRGPEGLAAAAALGVPLLALGGVTPARAGDCRRAGAVGVAVIRALLATENVAGETMSFLTRFRD